MLRTIFTIGIFAVLGWIAIQFIFGLVGALLGLFMTLLFLALKIGLILFVLYMIVRIVSPGTAQRIRERWSGRTI